MSDLIERADAMYVSNPTLPSCKLCKELADEIERLTDLLDEMTEKSTVVLGNSLEQNKEIERLNAGLHVESKLRQQYHIERDELLARVDALEGAAKIALRVIQSELVNAEVPLTSTAIEAELMLRAATEQESESDE